MALFDGGQPFWSMLVGAEGAGAVVVVALQVIAVIIEAGAVMVVVKVQLGCMSWKMVYIAR